MKDRLWSFFRHVFECSTFSGCAEQTGNGLKPQACSWKTFRGPCPQNSFLESIRFEFDGSPSPEQRTHPLFFLLAFFRSRSDFFHLLLSLLLVIRATDEEST